MYILCTRSQVRVQDTLKTYKFYKLWNHLRKVGIEVIRGVKVEGARHQVRRQRRPVQAARVVCPPRWTEVLGTKEQEEKTPEKSQVVILNTKLGCGGNSLVNKPWHTNKSEQGDKNNDKRQNALVFHVLAICEHLANWQMMPDVDLFAFPRKTDWSTLWEHFWGFLRDIWSARDFGSLSSMSHTKYYGLSFS